MAFAGIPTVVGLIPLGQVSVLNKRSGEACVEVIEKCGRERVVVLQSVILRVKDLIESSLVHPWSWETWEGALQLRLHSVRRTERQSLFLRNHEIQFLHVVVRLLWNGAIRSVVVENAWPSR